MSATFRIPDPPARAVDAHVVKTTLDRGRCAGCCVCELSCWTWWSPNPPSGYAPIHEKCVDRLFEHWDAMRAGGDMPTVTVEAAPTKRVGAYARLESVAPTGPASAVVVLTGQKAAVLPEGFRPGAFWLPGDTADGPWTMLAVTAAGVTATPCSTAERAREQARRLSLLKETSDRVPAVGAVVVAPDGTWSHCWGRVGNAPDRLECHEAGAPLFTLWRPITRMSDWWTCAGCHEMRWPGTWGEFVSLCCLVCLAHDEMDDPRPPLLIQPSRPGDRYLPEWFTKPARRLTLPKGFGRRGR